MTALAPVFGYTLRACVPVKRRLGLGLLCVAAMGFGLLARTIPDTRDHAFVQMATAALFGLILPLAGLVVGDAVLGAEVRAGTFHFTWLSPVRTLAIGLGRWAAGTLVVVTALAPSFFVAALLAGAPHAAGAAALGAIAGGAAYVAVFIAVGVLVRRAAVVSLVLVFLVERLLGGVLSGIAQLSPMWEARAVFTRLAPAGVFFHRDGIPDGWGAVVRLAIITAVALTIAIRRLRAIKLAGATD